MKRITSSLSRIGIIVIAIAPYVIADSKATEVCDSHDHHPPIPNEPIVEVSPSPENDPWFVTKDANSHLGDYSDFWKALDCDTIFAQDGPRPIHLPSSWMLMRGIYLGIVGPHLQTIDYRNRPIDGDGFVAPVRVEHLPDKGRSVVAAEDIPKGTTVWLSSFTARFPSPLYFRRFLSTLPRDLACDVMIWAYVEDYAWKDHDDDDETPTISVDLDAGSFFNTVHGTNIDKKNVDNDEYKTMRAILKGEELLIDYSDFEKEFSWSAAGFGSEEEGDEAWML